MRFSIVVPLFNKAPHVERALRSVFAQSIEDWELIVVDDASTDGGERLAESLIAGDRRARILRRDESGPGGYAARNLGIREARADWIAFLDADDEWAPGLLSEYERLRGLFPDLAFVGTAQREVMADGERSLDPFVASGRARGPERFDLMRYAEEGGAGRNPIHTSAVAAGRTLLLEIGGFPEGRCTRGGDRDTWLRLLAHTDFAWSPYLGATYYRNAVNMVTKTTVPLASTGMDRTFSELLADRALAARYPRGFRQRLMRLSNYERRGAIRKRIREGELRLSDARTLYFRGDPSYTAAVYLAASIPKGALRWLARLRDRMCHA